jgi:hypothetical protein
VLLSRIAIQLQASRPKCSGGSKSHSIDRELGHELRCTFLGVNMNNWTQHVPWPCDTRYGTRGLSVVLTLKRPFGLLLGGFLSRGGPGGSGAATAAALCDSLTRLSPFYQFWSLIYEVLAALKTTEETKL